MTKKVLVTGAGGFIGSHLVEELVKAGHEVRAFVHYNANSNWYNLENVPKDVLSQVEVVAGDIADPFSVDHAVKGCSMVFHLAALIGIPYSYVAPGNYVSTNVNGTLNVLEACRRYDVERMLHTSTSETYGTAQYTPIDEKHPLVGQSPYSATKIAADKLAESYWLSFQTPVTIVRPFNTFGPRQSMRAIIPTIIVQALTKGELTLGSLDPVRDLTFCTDTARGFVAASRSDKVIGELVNLGVGKGITIGDLVNLVADILGKELPVNTDQQRVRPAKSEVMELISDNGKARKLMGWEPEVSLREGLSQTIDFISRNLERFKADSYAV
ncbi:MAG: SDR family NAD(P)-dependent oxidoreductase [Ketobacteraceae bacterium]|nr:SDR family NAD(P)-dependent oxidoreductase [Ketobacteraceae bacterium]